MSDPERRIRVRLAPSPTGPPHVGNAYIGLFDQTFARHCGGDFILRIEDTDRERSTRESEEAILEAFKWIGLEWDEGPDVGGPFGPYRQSERSDTYRTYAEWLLDHGHAYRCFCTSVRLTQVRKAQRTDGSSSLGYDRHCRDLSPEKVNANLEAGLAYTVRLKVPLEGQTRFIDEVRGPVTIQNSEVDDQVLLKSDGFPTYHLANVVDDHLMKITHVVRAEEWVSSTPKHILLYQAFGWEPPTFVHMPLLRNADKSKISKRKNPTSLTWYREQGFLPAAMRNFLALMGWSIGDDREMFSTEEMVVNFSWDRVKTSGPVFDIRKLEWLNGEYIRASSSEDLLQIILQEGYTTHMSESAERLLLVTELVRERMKRLSVFDALTGFFFEREPYDAELLVPRKQTAAFARKALVLAAETLEALEVWSADALEAAMQALVDEQDWKRGALYMVLRVAVTCRTVSTPLFETMEIMDKQECLARIEDAIQKAETLG